MQLLLLELVFAIIAILSVILISVVLFYSSCHCFFVQAMWIVAGMFKWSPFGVVGQVHGDYYIWEG